MSVNKFNIKPVIKIAVAFLLAVIVMDSASLAVTPWNSDPVIDFDGITKAHDQEWFHITQSCTLTIEAFDEDTHCVTGPDGGDHINPNECEWSGPNISTTTGLTTTWQAPSWTTGDDISSIIDDDPVVPGDPNSVDKDDAAVDGPIVTMKAWEVCAVMSVSSTVSGTSDSNNITETGVGSTYSTTSTLSGSLACSLTKNAVAPATAAPYTTEYTHLVKEGINAKVDAEWVLTTAPSSAVPYGNPSGKCKVETENSGTLDITTDDEDDDLFGGGSVSVDWLWAVPGVSATYEVDIDLGGEDCEAGGGIGYYFGSDILEDCDKAIHQLAKSSGDWTNDDSASFSHDKGPQEFSGPLDTSPSREAHSAVEGAAEAKAVHYGPDAIQGHRTQDSSATITSTGTCSYICSDVSASNLSLNSSSVLITP